MGINYNNELELFKKGSVLIGTEDGGHHELWDTSSSEEQKHLQKRNITVLHCDIIRADFWDDHDSLLKSLNDVKKCKKIKIDK